MYLLTAGYAIHPDTIIPDCLLSILNSMSYSKFSFTVESLIMPHLMMHILTYCIAVSVDRVRTTDSFQSPVQVPVHVPSRRSTLPVARNHGLASLGARSNCKLNLLFSRTWRRIWGSAFDHSQAVRKLLINHHAQLRVARCPIHSGRRGPTIAHIGPHAATRSIDLT